MRTSEKKKHRATTVMPNKNMHKVFKELLCLDFRVYNYNGIKIQNLIVEDRMRSRGVGRQGKRDDLDFDLDYFSFSPLKMRPKFWAVTPKL